VADEPSISLLTVARAASVSHRIPEHHGAVTLAPVGDHLQDELQISRFLVEFLRINKPALLGLTQPQLWALASLIVGVSLIVRTQYLNGPRPIPAETPGTGEAVTARSEDAVTARSTPWLVKL
jgi:hypothetical protein